MIILPQLQDVTVTLEGRDGVLLDTFLAALYLESKCRIFGINFDLADAEKKAEELYRENLTEEEKSQP